MNGMSILQSYVLGSTPSNWSIVGQRDFNGDGNADVLWRDNHGNVAIWLMSGSTITSSTVLGNVASNWSIVGTGDFNGDGNADILWRDNLGNLDIWFMNGTTITQIELSWAMCRPTGSSREQTCGATSSGATPRPGKSACG